MCALARNDVVVFRMFKTAIQPDGGFRLSWSGKKWRGSDNAFHRDANQGLKCCGFPPKCFPRGEAVAHRLFGTDGRLMRNAGDNVMILKMWRPLPRACLKVNSGEGLLCCSDLQISARIPLPTPFGGHPLPGRGDWSCFVATHSFTSTGSLTSMRSTSTAQSIAMSCTPLAAASRSARPISGSVSWWGRMYLTSDIWMTKRM